MISVMVITTPQVTENTLFGGTSASDAQKHRVLEVCAMLLIAVIMYTWGLIIMTNV